MRSYEIVIIFDAGLDESNIGEILENVSEQIRSKGGKPGKSEHWGKRRFTYEISGKFEGYYVVLEVSSSPEAVSEASRSLSLIDEVIRHKVIRIPDEVAGRQYKPVLGSTQGISENPAVALNQ